MEISETEHDDGRIDGRILIRRSSLEDLQQLVAISRAAENAAHWNEQQWRDIFHTQIPPRLAWLAWDLRDPVDSPDSALRGAQAKAQAQAAVPPSCGRFGTAIGFLVAQCGGADWELENMAVLPGFRCHGAGSALLATLLAEARAHQAERILLEVRPSNQPAIRLYEQGGFARLACRPDYYRDPLEDALIMVHAL